MVGKAPQSVALVTAAVARDLDEDLAPLLAAFEPTATDVAVVDWDDPDVRWADFDLAVVRSTWDYTTRHGEFLEWSRRVDALTRLINPAAVLEWNSDKRYFDDLTAAGVEVVPSSFWDSECRGGTTARPSFPTDSEFVVKPTVSAGSRDTARYRPSQVSDATDHVQRIWASGRTAMVQPYLDAVDVAGETALLFFGGSFSHAIRKGPLLELDNDPTRALFAEEHITARTPAADEMEVGQFTVDAVAQLENLGLGGRAPTYARVDLLRSADGRPLVLEVELAEPSLFLDTDPGAARRFVDAVLQS